jgi:nitroimidazol reductase NimA-like FMN-containing flavoprotein (pyridoxamine 5'-phosphate oxidase superfamily)
MFREMRRVKQALSREECIAILKASTAGVLGLAGDNDYPYTVPISYVYKEDKLFFHCAKEGHKIDSILRNNKVSFCVIDQDQVIQEKLTTHYRSVIVFGRARILTDDAERRSALESLVEKYAPDYIEAGKQEIKRDWNRVCIVGLIIEHMTGKATLDLVKNKE